MCQKSKTTSDIFFTAFLPLDFHLLLPCREEKMVENGNKKQWYANVFHLVGNINKK